ncbi:MAG TPA: ABC transporter permease [Roseiflexaceae bacterium]|nr:ABC transporter permease [Roseiflexaceae bacterium]
MGDRQWALRARAGRADYGPSPMAPALAKPFIRLLSFFAKEVNEVRRQPRLVLSLLLGPFAILLLFGSGYQGNQPLLRTAIVVPPGSENDLDVRALREIGGLNFKLEGVTTDREAALAQLRAGELDVVQIVPDDIRERVARGEQPEVQFIYNQINPLNEQWIKYLGYAEVVEINKNLLLNTTANVQSQAQDLRAQLADVRQQLDELEAGLSSADPQRLQASVRRLKEASGALALGGLAAGAEGAALRGELAQLQEDLDTLDRAVSAGQLEAQRDRIRATRERIARLEQMTAEFSELPPAVIVSPLQQSYQNLNGASYDLMTYYAPSVLALLVQHIAVTLGALSLVRERLLGATEIFRVAPVTVRQVLVGKYLGYTVFIGVIATVLVGLMRLLNVPFLGDPLVFAGLTLLLTLASLGVGFFISAISNSDSQAVQLSMLVLLLSVFFSGFFLPLENFYEPVRAVSYSLPLTHGIAGYHDVMLRGTLPGQLGWLALGAIAAVSFIGALAGAWRQFRKILQ